MIKPFGLKVKLFIYATLMTLFGALILNLVLIKHGRGIIENELKKRGLFLSRRISYSIKSGNLIDNRDILLQVINRIMKEEDEVIYCLIQDVSGVRIAGNIVEAENKKQRARIDEKALNTQEPIVQYIDSMEVGRFYELAAPIMVGIGADGQELDLWKGGGQSTAVSKIGIVRIGISLVNTNIFISKIHKELTLTSLLIISIYLLFIILLVNSIINPILVLAKGIRRVAEGDLDYQVDIKSRDEVGWLANSFNQMTRQLKKSHQELKQWASTLEQRMTERTRELEEEKNKSEIKVRQRTKELEEARANLEGKVQERTQELQKSKEELQNKLEELERFHKLTMGRELRLIELKEKINTLEEEIRYLKGSSDAA